MASSTPSPTELIHAYRCLYKSLLYAVRYSKPSRYIVRDQLRNAFRRSAPSAFDEAKIARTLEFIQGAGRERGIENQILKGLCQAELWRKKDAAYPKQGKLRGVADHLNTTAFDHYNNTIAMLNDSMGMCLPIH